MIDFELISFNANFDFTQIKFKLINPLIFFEGIDTWKVTFQISRNNLEIIDSEKDTYKKIIIRFTFSNCKDDELIGKEVAANLSKRYNLSDITKENIEKAFTLRRLFKI